MPLGGVADAGAGGAGWPLLRRLAPKAFASAATGNGAEGRDRSDVLSGWLRSRPRCGVRSCLPGAFGLRGAGRGSGAAVAVRSGRGRSCRVRRVSRDEQSRWRVGNLRSGDRGRRRYRLRAVRRQFIVRFGVEGAGFGSRPGDEASGAVGDGRGTLGDAAFRPSGVACGFGSRGSGSGSKAETRSCTRDAGRRRRSLGGTVLS